MVAEDLKVNLQPLGEQRSRQTDGSFNDLFFFDLCFFFDLEGGGLGIRKNARC